MEVIIDSNIFIHYFYQNKNQLVVLLDKSFCSRREIDFPKVEKVLCE